MYHRYLHHKNIKWNEAFVVWLVYNMVGFLPNPHNSLSIVCSFRVNYGLFLWVKSLYVPPWLSSMYRIWLFHCMIGYLLITRPVCTKENYNEVLTIEPIESGKNHHRTCFILHYISVKIAWLSYHNDVINVHVTGPLCGEITGSGEFPTQRSVTWSLDVFFDLRLNKRLSKQPWGWWFETPSWSLRHHCNEHPIYILLIVQPCHTSVLASATAINLHNGWW